MRGCTASWPTGAEAASECQRGPAPTVRAALPFHHVEHASRKRSPALQVHGNGDWTVLRAQTTRGKCRGVAVGPCGDLAPEAAIAEERNAKC